MSYLKTSAWSILYTFCFLVPDVTACQIAVEKALQTLASLDRFVPRCKEDGSFEDVQCSEFIGECWCVDSSGMEQRGSRSQDFITCPGMGKPILIMKVKKEFHLLYCYLT